MIPKGYKINDKILTENQNEKDLSTQIETEKQSSWLQKENGNHRRKKGFEEKKKQGPQKDKRLKRRRGMRYLRLKKNTDFKKLFKRGKRVFSPRITLLYVPSSVQIMGIALSKKHGKAVQRNRLKRLIRAAYDKNVNMLNAGYSVVVMPRAGEVFTFGQVEKGLITCFKKINAECQKGSE